MEYLKLKTNGSIYSRLSLAEPWINEMEKISEEIFQSI